MWIVGSVTARIKEVKQPFGAYIQNKMFISKQFNDNNEVKPLSDKYYSMIQGTMVDNLVRVACGFNKLEVFKLSIGGAMLVDKAMMGFMPNYNGVRAVNSTHKLINGITGLDDDSLHCAFRLVELEGCYRNIDNVIKIDVYDLLEPCDYSEFSVMANNVRIMVDRTVKFIGSFGNAPKISGLTFEGGYTSTVNSGDCDYVIGDTLVDLKCSVSKYMRSDWSLQLAMYYIMGLHSKNSEIFKGVKKLCIFNAVYNKSYTLDISKIDDKTMYIISKFVLGYNMLSNNIRDWRNVSL